MKTKKKNAKLNKNSEEKIVVNIYKKKPTVSR